MREAEMFDDAMQESPMDDDLQIWHEFGRILGEMALEEEARQEHLMAVRAAQEEALCYYMVGMGVSAAVF